MNRRPPLAGVLLAAALLTTACDEDFPGLAEDIREVTGVDTSSPTGAATGLVKNMSGTPSGDPEESNEFEDALGVMETFRQKQNEFLGDKAKDKGDFDAAAKHYRNSLDWMPEDEDKDPAKRAALLRKLAEAEDIRVRPYPGNSRRGDDEVRSALKSSGEALSKAADLTKGEDSDARDQRFADRSRAVSGFLIAGYTSEACGQLNLLNFQILTNEQRAWNDRMRADHCAGR